MIWKKVSDYAIRSSCLRYGISKTFHGGRVNYGAWRGKEVIGDFDAVESAKACCEEDLRASALKEAA